MAAPLVSAGQKPSRPRRKPIRPSEPMATLVNRVSRPTRLNCWKIMPMRMRVRRTSRSTRPWACTAPPKASMRPGPLSIGARPLMARSRVDLPDPEGPIRAIISPRATSRETVSSARRDPKLFDTWRTERTAASDMNGEYPLGVWRPNSYQRVIAEPHDGFMTWAPGAVQRGAYGATSRGRPTGGRGRSTPGRPRTFLASALYIAFRCHYLHRLRRTPLS